MLRFLIALGCGKVKLQDFAVSHQDCVPMPDVMLHFLEQNAVHSAQLQEKDDEIARLRSEVDTLKLSHKSELEKVDQEFFEEKNRLTLDLQKNKELLEAAELKTRGLSEEIARFEKSKADWAKDLQRMMSYIHRKLLGLAELYFSFFVPAIL